MDSSFYGLDLMKHVRPGTIASCSEDELRYTMSYDALALMQLQISMYIESAENTGLSDQEDCIRRMAFSNSGYVLHYST